MPKGIQIVPVLKLKNAPKDVQANRPIGVDVGVVDPGCERYLQCNATYSLLRLVQNTDKEEKEIDGVSPLGAWRGSRWGSEL